MNIKKLIIGIIIGVLILYIIIEVLKVKRETANWIAIAFVAILLIVNYIRKRHSISTKSDPSDKIENNKNAAND